MGAVVVTGGAGFLGSHLAPAPAGAGAARIRVVDVVDEPPWARGIGVEYVVADVTDPRAAGAVVEGADVVVHAAFAPPDAPPDRLHAVNVGATESVCASSARAGVRQLVVVSSTIVTLPARRHPVLRSAPLNRLDAYRSTRAQAEVVARGFASAGTRVALVRPKTFVGPGRVGGFAIVFDLIRAGRAVPIAGPGTNRYQLLDIRDFADGLVALVDRGGDGVFEFGALEFGTVAEDLGALIDAAGTGSRLRPLPGVVGRVAVRAVELAGLAPLAEWHHRTAQGRDSVVDITRARVELGWTPTRSNARSLIDAYRWQETTLAAGATAPTTRPVPRSHQRLGQLARRLLR